MYCASTTQGRNMGRRIFISFQSDDTNQAKGFNLLRWNPNVDRLSQSTLGPPTVADARNENRSHIGKG